MKTLLILSLLWLSACGYGPIKSKLSFTNAEPTMPVELVFDEALKGSKPFHFRKNENLKISGSANFSEKAAKAVAKLSEVVTVMDLNQESHGLINGLPVTWAAEKNWANANLNNEEAVNREKRYLAGVKIGDKLGKVKIKSVETEESLVRELGQNYVRLAVTEHLRPTDQEVERFLEAVRSLPTESWIHFHDRMGEERTTIFMTMFDMLVTAQTQDFETIISRNQALSHEGNLLEVSPEGDWRRPFQEDKVKFLKEFYVYAKKHPRSDKAAWSQRGDQ